MAIEPVLLEIVGAPTIEKRDSLGFSASPSDEIMVCGDPGQRDLRDARASW
jgi:hypothetical protein